MTIRDERLANDYRALQKMCAFYEPVKIKILEKRDYPPEYYKLKLSNCKGIESVVGNKPKYRTEHILIIEKFPLKYSEPGELPTVRLETPIYHPNVFSHGGFCFIGKELKKLPQPLDALLKRIIGMIQYENLEFGKPANNNACNWANNNKHLFPLSS